MYRRRNPEYPFTVQDLERLIEELISIRRLYKSTTVWKLSNVKQNFERLMENFESVREDESVNGTYKGFELTDNRYEKIFEDFDFGMIDKNKTIERINYIKHRKVEEEYEHEDNMEEETVHERDIEYSDDSTDECENINESIEKDCNESIEECIHEEEEDDISTRPNIDDSDQSDIKVPRWTDSDEEETVKEDTNDVQTEQITQNINEEVDVQTAQITKSIEEGVKESIAPEASESYESYRKLLDYFNNKYKNETT